MKIIRTEKNKKLRILVVVTAVILFAGLASYIVYANSNQLWPFLAKETPVESGHDTNSINYNPPTDKEVESSQDGKKNSSENTNENETLTSINLIVSYAGLSDDKTAIEVNAYTPDVIEGTGKCTATLTKDSSTVNKESSAMVDARSSICEPILIPLTEFNSNGTWQLSVSYKSPKYTATSSKQDVRINQ